MIWGWAVSVAVLAPNVIWMALPPVGLPSEQTQPSRSQRALEVLEHIGRVGMFVLPLFYDFHLKSTAERVCLVAAIFALGAYYAGWLRYFSNGRQFKLLFAPMLGLPVPLAVSPVVACLAVSVPLHSWPLASVAVLFGVVHIALSLDKR